MTGVTVVMPAYREEENLSATVEDFLRTLEAAGERHRVVVVDDGSPDETGRIADDLAARYPGRVEVVHHEVNRGYGAAVRTGISAALGHADSQRVFLTDSDGQFRADQLPGFLDLARTERADAVIGYRTRRADPLIRRVNGVLWTLLSRALLRVGARDIDCAYKLVDKRVLAGLDLRGNAALISPELVAKIRAKDARILQKPVQHYPRQYGEQTGARPTVILRSLLGLLGLWLELIRSGPAGAAVRRVLRPADRTLAGLTVLAVGASVGAYLFYDRRGLTLAYPDAVSHLLIARRVVEATTPGAGQLGAVWLPLPHLLALAGIWNDRLYESGLAGSLVSMAAYVVTVRYLYKGGRALTGSVLAGLIAAVVFGANPNVLYLQSTAMTEMLLIACIAATAYHLTRWCQSGSYRQLAATGAATLAATLTRYEGWVLALAVTVVVGYVSWRQAGADGGRPRDRVRRIEADALFFAFLGCSGIAGWIAWNTVIFGSPLYFQNGVFSRPSLWVSHSEATIGNWGVSLQTYLYAMRDDIGTVALLLGACGVIAHLVINRLRPATVAPLALLVFLPFFTYALYSGQRPLHVREMSGDLYNLRFGLLMIVPVALFSGDLVTCAHRWSRRRLRGVVQIAVAGAAAVAVLATALGGVITLDEAKAFRATADERANAAAAGWLRTHYDGGRVLIESFGNETVTFASRLPTARIVYEGSYRQWEPALADPVGHHIRWIYMRRTQGNSDDTWKALGGTMTLRAYDLVYQDQSRVIYRSAAGPQR